MAETVIKKYHCDFCGAEIDQNDLKSIHVFIQQTHTNNHRKEGLVVKPMRQLTDATRHAIAIMENGDYCSVEHFAAHIEKKIQGQREGKW